MTHDLRDRGRENRERIERNRRDYLLLGSRSPSRWPWRWATAWVAVAMDFPWLALDLDQIGISVGRLATRRTSYHVPRPPPLYIALPQGPTNHISVGRPRSGRETRSGSSRWTRSCEINLTVTSRIVVSGKYIAFNAIQQSESGFCRMPQLFLASMAMLKICRSLNPRLPSNDCKYTGCM
jgi:hypothetical protein